MTRIETARFGFAWGVTLAFLYIGCMLVLWTVGKEGAVLFFNSLMHGLDVSSIIRLEMSIWEMVIGIIEIFIMGWLIGATIASVYNFSLKRSWN